MCVCERERERERPQKEQIRIIKVYKCSFMQITLIVPKVNKISRDNYIRAT